MRQVDYIMGIPISVDIPGSTGDHVFAAIFKRLCAIDTSFSTYKKDSEVSRYRRDELLDTQLSAEFRHIQEACATFETVTDGYFSAYYNGSFDPTGYVKGWAIQEAGKIIEQHGFHTYLINAAGDILAASAGEKTWQVALQNPFDPQAVLGAINLKNGAIATSGTYERGQHIFDPHTKQATHATVSATIYGPNIVTADVFATACVAMTPKKAINFINRQDGYEALLVDLKGNVMTSQNFTGS